MCFAIKVWTSIRIFHTCGIWLVVNYVIDIITIVPASNVYFSILACMCSPLWISGSCHVLHVIRRPNCPWVCYRRLDFVSCVVPTLYCLVFWFVSVNILWLWLGPIGLLWFRLYVCEVFDFISIFLWIIFYPLRSFADFHISILDSVTIFIDVFFYICVRALSWCWPVYVYRSWGLEMLGYIVCELSHFILFHVSLLPFFAKVSLTAVWCEM